MIGEFMSIVRRR